MLPDDVLLDIFDFYQMDPCYESDPWIWHTLVHVCRRWRQLIFASPRRLDLQLVCTPRTRVRELLDFLPPMPVMIRNFFDPSQPRSNISLEDGSQVIAAVEQRDNVWCIDLEDLPSTLVDKLGTTMQETFQMLSYVRLCAEDEMAPVLPDSFLGGSVPLLKTFWLRGIPFPEVPKLLSSASELVFLRLEKIPDSGYFSPEALVAGLASCTMLEALLIGFLSPYPHPDLTSRQITLPTLISLPGLTCFGFEGNGAYFHKLLRRIENPLLPEDINELEDTVNRHVHYESSLTPAGFSFETWNRPLRPVEDPVQEEG
jgi:hypothetical protein